MPKCRACGAPISWIKTRSGRVMPVNAMGERYKPEPEGKALFVTKDGRVERGTRYPDRNLNVCIGYISHFATCPKAEEMRKK